MKTRESYDEVFYSNQRDGSYKSASVVVPMLVDFFRPGSVLDIGCGVGTWLRAFKDNGVDDVIGVDGAYVSAASLLIPPQQFRAHDLTREVVLDRRFDLAMSLEVAEHLPEECARQIVEVLTYSADVVVFSAAIPDQQGTNHVNEQWQSYWAGHFKDRGYDAFDLIRPKIWNCDDVDYWYRQNMIVYLNTAAQQRYGVASPAAKLSILDLVHPELLRVRTEQLPGIRKSLKGIKSSVIHHLSQTPFAKS